MDNIHPSVLTIAGSDSGGGAGIQTDLRSFNAFKVYGCSVITAVTAQNPDAVRQVDVQSEKSVRAQLESVLEVIPVQFAKTGMLANREIVECTAELIEKHALQTVVDPVMVSTSGTRLLAETAISAVREKLFPLARWITPNIPEAELLCGRKLPEPDALAEAALQLYRKYGCNCLLKSGHALTSDKATDVICYEGQLFSLSSPIASVQGHTAHGTGCTLSAALAAGLASGKSWQEAVMTAKAFVYGSLCENIKLNDRLSQMYPPVKNYFDQITLDKL
jgi:hydroxymethylpyrimidine kinase/phosphomethylpyrimidine kinase